LKRDEEVRFYPSHLTKGLVATGVSMVTGMISIVSWRYALREFTKIGQDVYPEVQIAARRLPETS
jgi:hypothetical protein